MSIAKAYGTPFLNWKVGTSLGTYTCDEDGICVDDTTVYGGSSGGSCPGSPGCPGYPGGSGGGFNWANLANTLTTDFTRIWGAIRPVPNGCTQYTGPNGTLYTSCSQSGQAPGLPGIFGGGGSSSSWLLIAALGIGAVLLLSKK